MWHYIFLLLLSRICNQISGFGYEKGLVIRFMQSNVKFVDQFLFIALFFVMVSTNFYH